MNRQEVSKRLAILGFVMTYPIAFLLGMLQMHSLGITMEFSSIFDQSTWWNVYYDFQVWEIVKQGLNLLIVSMVVLVFAIIYVTEFAKEGNE